MANLKVLRFTIDGDTYEIPSASATQDGIISKSDYTKLQGIASGAQVNVLEGVKVNGVALSIASKIVDILIATGATNGTIKVNGADVAVRGLAALAYKAKVSQSDLDTALAAVLDAKATQADLNTLSGKVDVLNGTGVGSVKKAIDDAFNDFSTKVSDDNVVNSYKELIDWAAKHGGEAAQMAASIATIEGLLAGIGGSGQPATVMAAITKAINDLNIGNYYTKAQVNTELDKKVDKVTGKGLSKNDFTDALKTKLDGISAGATANTYSYNSTSQTLTLTGFKAQS